MSKESLYVHCSHTPVISYRRGTDWRDGHGGYRAADRLIFCGARDPRLPAKKQTSTVYIKLYLYKQWRLGWK